MSSRAHLRTAAALLVAMNPGVHRADLVDWLGGDDRPADIVKAVDAAAARGLIVVRGDRCHPPARPARRWRPP